MTKIIIITQTHKFNRASIDMVKISVVTRYYLRLCEDIFAQIRLMSFMRKTWDHRVKRIR